MTLVARSALASIDASTAMYAPQITGLIAGAALDVAAPCYINSTDGLVYMSDGTAAVEAAEIVGFTARAVAIGQPVTLFGYGTRFRYSASLLTPGDYYYLATTAGRIDTAATTGDTIGVAQALTATDIMVITKAPRLTSATVGAGTITATELGPQAVTEPKVQVGAASAGLSGLVVKFAADANVIGAIPVIHIIHVTAGANGDTDVTLTHKTRILDAWVIPTTTVAASTLQIKNVTNAVTDAMVAAVTGTITRAASIVYAYRDIAAGTVLRVTGTGGTTMPAADVYVLGLRVA